jgi:hypothetical protein
MPGGQYFTINPVTYAKHHDEGWTGARMQRCGAYPPDAPMLDCRMVRGHPGPHQFERWSP